MKWHAAPAELQNLTLENTVRQEISAAFQRRQGAALRLCLKHAALEETT
jgi:hypothetical protein